MWMQTFFVCFFGLFVMRCNCDFYGVSYLFEYGYHFCCSEIDITKWRRAFARARFAYLPVDATRQILDKQTILGAKGRSIESNGNMVGWSCYKNIRIGVRRERWEWLHVHTFKNTQMRKWSDGWNCDATLRMWWEPVWWWYCADLYNMTGGEYFGIILRSSRRGKTQKAKIFQYFSVAE